MMFRKIRSMLFGSTPGPVYCSNCGAPNPAGSTFCQGCGKALNP